MKFDVSGSRDWPVSISVPNLVKIPQTGGRVVAIYVFKMAAGSHLGFSQILLLPGRLWLFADDKWSGWGCNSKPSWGTYLWTAGQRERSIPYIEEKFLWRVKIFPANRHDSGVREDTKMPYTKWDRPSGQPDWYGGGTDSCNEVDYYNCESCLNLWPERGYTWNDEPCGNKYCFVCQRVESVD